MAGSIVVIPGAEEQGMTHRESVELLESVEDTLDFYLAGLSYLKHAESKKAQPDTALIAQWQTWWSQTQDLQHYLFKENVETYRQVLETYRQRNRDMREIIDRYMAGASE